ncbi:MAG: hypothetical protein B0W54_06750 [Cellvibrio sp. 79]|nr:MAG: hypothetical protein B0W54_06750 [Cellvibrio sp. 79]
MGIKMSAAIDANGNLINIAKAEQGRFIKPLHCETCSAGISFVDGFNRQIGDEIISVDPYFRLQRDNQHSPGCKYNVEGQIKVIARTSEPDIFNQIKNNQFELRLVAVKKAISDLKELAQKEANDKETKSGTGAREKKYIDAEERLTGYINSAMRVLKVRAICEDHTEIQNVLELVFDGTRLAWKDFFFDDSNYFQCYRNITRATIKTPIAIQGTIKDIRNIAGKNGPLAVINLIAPTRKTDSEHILDSAKCSIWTNNPDRFNAYKSGDQIIAFGMWDAKEVKESPNNNAAAKIKVFRNHEVSLWPITKGQICLA